MMVQHKSHHCYPHLGLHRRPNEHVPMLRTLCAAHEFRGSSNSTVNCNTNEENNNNNERNGSGILHTDIVNERARKKAPKR